MSDPVFARVSTWIDGPPQPIFDAFIQPHSLTRFWLSSAEAPLTLGRTVRWSFLVEGAEVDTTATRLERPDVLAWDWSDGSRVVVTLEAIAGGTAVTIVNDCLDSAGGDQVAAALNATEGFAIVLSDLKTWIETGTSAGLTRAKAKLIELRR